MIKIVCESFSPGPICSLGGPDDLLLSTVLVLHIYGFHGSEVNLAAVMG